MGRAPGLQRATGAMLVLERLRADNPERTRLPAATRVRPAVVQEARLNLSNVPEEEGAPLDRAEPEESAGAVGGAGVGLPVSPVATSARAKEETSLATAVLAAALSGLGVPPFLDHALGESDVTSSRDSITSRVGSSFVDRDTDSADDRSYAPSQASTEFSFRE